MVITSAWVRKHLNIQHSAWFQCMFGRKADLVDLYDLASPDTRRVILMNLTPRRRKAFMHEWIRVPQGYKHVTRGYIRPGDRIFKVTENRFIDVTFSPKVNVSNFYFVIRRIK